MSTLAANKLRVFELGGDPGLEEVPSIASDITYAGAAVGESTTTGTDRPLAGGDVFRGFCTEKCDNSAGAASAKNIKVMTRGVVKLTGVTGLDNVNDAGAVVYATDDDTFTMTASGASGIGKVVRYLGTSGEGLVYFEGESRRSI
jgi:hypothetical protein